MIADMRHWLPALLITCTGACSDPRPASVPPAPAATAAVATSDAEELRAFAKLYGYVRFFHPSDEAASADWNAVAIKGARRVVQGRTQSALIGNVPATTFLSAEKLNAVVENTKKGGATLTGLIGTSAWLAPGAGTCLMVGRVRPCSVELQGQFGVKGAFVGVPVKLTAKGAEAAYEFELPASRKGAFTKSVAANTELMNIARGFLG